MPWVIPVAGYLLSLDLHADTSLLNFLQTDPASVAAILLVCLLAGKGRTERGGPLAGHLLAGATAGAVGVLGTLALREGLLLADASLGISNTVISLQGGSVSYGGSGSSLVAAFVSAPALLFDAAATVVAGAVGAAVAAAGMALAGLRVTRDARST